VASLIQDPNGLKRIQWTTAEGKRKTLRLGRMSMKQAEAAKLHIEHLLAATETGTADPEALRWLSRLTDKIYERVAAHALAPRRQPAASKTLAALLDSFFATINVKPQTKTTYTQTRQSLERRFGASGSLGSVTPLEAERWKQAMLDEGLAPATVSKRVKTARQIFRCGVKWQMLTANPFDEVRAGAQVNRERLRFITRETIQKVIDACPDAEWRLIVALSRYGGLRCPSEHLSLRWSDIDWEHRRVTVTSPKTAGQKKDSRVMPLFPELAQYLRAAFEEAPEGSKWVIARYRQPNCNLRTMLLRILRRASVEPWPRLFQNLRASRETELCEEFPTHVVTAWLGNTEAVAKAHYLQVTDNHFERAAAPKNAAQNAAQPATAIARTEQHRSR
jgi:integrase